MLEENEVCSQKFIAPTIDGQASSGGYWLCTRSKDHEGVHVAHGMRSEVIAVSQPEEFVALDDQIRSVLDLLPEQIEYLRTAIDKIEDMFEALNAAWEASPEVQPMPEDAIILEEDK